MDPAAPERPKLWLLARGRSSTRTFSFLHRPRTSHIGIHFVVLKHNTPLRFLKNGFPWSPQMARPCTWFTEVCPGFVLNLCVVGCQASLALLRCLWHHILPRIEGSGRRCKVYVALELQRIVLTALPSQLRNSATILATLTLRKLQRRARITRRYLYLLWVSLNR